MICCIFPGERRRWRLIFKGRTQFDPLGFRQFAADLQGTRGAASLPLNRHFERAGVGKNWIEQGFKCSTPMSPPRFVRNGTPMQKSLSFALALCLTLNGCGLFRPSETWTLVRGMRVDTRG